MFTKQSRVSFFEVTLHVLKVGFSSVRVSYALAPTQHLSYLIKKSDKFVHCTLWGPGRSHIQQKRGGDVIVGKPYQAYCLCESVTRGHI